MFFSFYYCFGMESCSVAQACLKTQKLKIYSFIHSPNNCLSICYAKYCSCHWVSLFLVLVSVRNREVQTDRQDSSPACLHIQMYIHSGNLCEMDVYLLS